MIVQAKSNSPLVGQWASVRGEKRYLFQENGSYQYTIVGCGSISCGGAEIKGVYADKDGILTLRQQTESWYPNRSVTGQRPGYTDKPSPDNKKFSYRLVTDTLSLREIPGEAREQEFHRVKN